MWGTDGDRILQATPDFNGVLHGHPDAANQATFVFIPQETASVGGAKAWAIIPFRISTGKLVTSRAEWFANTPVSALLADLRRVFFFDNMTVRAG